MVSRGLGKTAQKEAFVVDVAEGAGPVERLHNLVLALTGRVDDDAVNSVREMLGIGQLDAAAEFLAGCLLAGRIPVTSTEQYHLRRALEEARSQQALADRLHVVEAVPDEGHRFSDEHDQDRSDRELVDALAPIAGRLHGVRALWCAWRTTPAGVTYGAVPRRVLLAEVGSDGSVAAAGYQLLEAVRRAGLGCSVDVFNSGMDLPPYHRNALANARRVHLDLGSQIAVPNGSNHARAPRATAGSKAGGADAPSEPATGSGKRAEAPAPEPAAFDSARPDYAEPAHLDPGEADLAPVGRERAGERAGRERGDWERTEREHAERERPDREHADRERAKPDPVAAERAEPALSAQPESQAHPESAHAEPEPAPAPEPDAPEQGEQTVQTGGKNTRVPAAVDAKLTDRERNLLRKLHEELAQREQDKETAGEQVAGEQVAAGGKSAGSGQDAWTATMPGTPTGGFPSIGAPTSSGRERPGSE